MRQSCLLPEGQTGGTGTGTGGVSTGTGIGGGTVTGTVINPGNVLTHGQSSFTICENQVYLPLILLRPVHFFFIPVKEI